MTANTGVEFDDGFDYEPKTSRPRFHRTRIALKWLATFIFFALVLVFLFLVWSTRRSFPAIEGDIEIAGLDGDVEVVRDANGIPHIYATSRRSVYSIKKLVHAQDRFWQMDTWRHIGAGRLSEMFGEDQLETDAFLRTMDWIELAERQHAAATPEGRAALAGYTAGVNAYLASRSPAELGFEYTILDLVNRDYSPDPWTAIDSLVWGKVMAWDLRGNMDDEITRAFLLDDFTPEEVALLYPPYPAEHPVIVGNSQPRVAGASLDPPPVDALQTIGSTFQSITRLDAAIGTQGVGVGSNSWVIAPEKSATGAAILANDPHLGPRMPSIWYQVSLHCSPKTEACPLDVTGFSFAGMPGVIIGHNAQIAWGLTNLGPDVMDLYIERINPDNELQYEVNGSWVDMEVRTETIEIAGADSVDVLVRNTRHGPIISDDYDIFEDFSDNSGIPLPDQYEVALRWTNLEENPALVDAVLAINHAQDFDEFRDALRLFDVPSQNMVYADIEGNIGYQAPGKIPIREGWDGRLPVPGWASEFEWSGYVPFDELPYVLNPAEGYIVTANNPVVDDSYPHLLTTDWNYGDRAYRIVEMVEADDSIDLDDIAAMQLDTHNRHAERLVPSLVDVNLSGEEPTVVRAREILAEWDRNNDADSAGAAIFEGIWRQLLKLTFHDDLEEDIWPRGGSRWSLAVEEMMVFPKLRMWDDSTTAIVEERDDILKAAFVAGVAEVESLLGGSPDEWEWGRLHLAVFRNETLGESGVGLIEGRFNRGPYTVGGGTDIVHAIGYRSNESFEVAWIPSMRMIVDMGELQNSRAIHSTGQSGHAYSSHYQDMAEKWAEGEYLPLHWEEEAVRTGAEGLLVLRPTG